MRTIRQTATFKRDLKRVARGKYRQSLQTDFTAIVEILARDLELPNSLRDHALTGNWNDHPKNGGWTAARVRPAWWLTRHNEAE